MLLASAYVLRDELFDFLSNPEIVLFLSGVKEGIEQWGAILITRHVRHMLNPEFSRNTCRAFLIAKQDYFTSRLQS